MSAFGAISTGTTQAITIMMFQWKFRPPIWRFGEIAMGGALL